jgi:mersacidin/lichenicidin family type 2 lantibiotic
MGSKSETTKKVLTAIVAVNGLALTTGSAVKLTAEQIVKAWESPEYRQTLTAEQMKQLPANPAGDLMIQTPENGKFELQANTQYNGCDTQYNGCNTQYNGCDTQYNGCDTQYNGCATQYGGCLGRA